MVIYDNLTNKPFDERRFCLPISVWEEAYQLSIEFLKNAYENAHYESLEKLNDDFNSYIRSKYPNSKQDVERYAAGKATRRTVTHPLSLNMEARLRLDCLGER